MRNLHSIFNHHTEAFVWAYAYGRNGRILGRGNGTATRWQGGFPILHSYPVERGFPIIPTNEPQPWRRESRQWWSPWATLTLAPVQTLLNPACGRLPTSSRDPMIQLGSAPYPGTADTNRLCPNCLAIRPQTTYASTLVASDPWTLMPRVLRQTTPDPVSGL